MPNGGNIINYFSFLKVKSYGLDGAEI